MARYPDLDLQVLIPQRWKNYGKWFQAEAPDEERPYYRVGKIRWPWMGPAQWYLHWYPEMESLLRNFQPDIIDIWEEPWGVVSAQVCRLRNRLLPKTKVISETEQNIDKKLPFPFEHFRAYTLRNANFAIGRNQEALEVLRKKRYQGPAQVVPNAVDAELFRPLSKEESRGKLGLSGFVVGYVGRLVEEKGLDDLIDALSYLPEEVQVVLVGEGSYRAALEARVAAQRKEGRVQFLGAKPLLELPEVMNALDVLVLPSRTTPRWKEQFGRVIIEAQACAIPVIGSSSGAIPDVVGEGGMVYPERDSKALAEAIKMMHNNPEKRVRMGRAGRDAVMTNYTWQRVAAQMREIYLKLMNFTEEASA